MLLPIMLSTVLLCVACSRPGVTLMLLPIMLSTVLLCVTCMYVGHHICELHKCGGEPLCLVGDGALGTCQCPPERLRVPTVVNGVEDPFHANCIRECSNLYTLHKLYLNAVTLS